MDAVIIATQKNEGIFLVEWIAHHLAVGFGHIVIATNDCEDGSDALIDAIAARYPVSRIDNSATLDGLTIQQSATTRGLATDVARAADWVLHIDIDEFVTLAEPGLTLAGFLTRHADAHAVALAWRLFGDAGRAHWDGGLVTEAFMLAQAAPVGDGPVAHKTLFRPAAFAATSAHIPKAPTLPPEALRIVNAAGAPIPNDAAYAARGSAFRMTPGLWVWDPVRVNHYMVKSTDLVRLKLARGDANRRKSDKRSPGHPEFERRNRNSLRDDAILASRGARMARINEMLSVPAIWRAHADCLRWFLDRKTALDAP